MFGVKVKILCSKTDYEKFNTILDKNINILIITKNKERIKQEIIKRNSCIHYSNRNKLVEISLTRFNRIYYIYTPNELNFIRGLRVDKIIIEKRCKIDKSILYPIIDTGEIYEI